VEDICKECYVFANRHRHLANHTMRQDIGDDVSNSDSNDDTDADVDSNLGDNFGETVEAKNVQQEERELMLLQAAEHVKMARIQRTLYQQKVAHSRCPGHSFNVDGSYSLDENVEITYTLDDMTPEMVHYGSVPESVLVEEIENVRRIVDSEFAGSNDAEMLRNLTKVCNNTMKQYRRSRPEASREGVRRAKAILEGEKETGTGRRVLTARGGIPSHPLLRWIEVD
jgi:hypothetical protein